LGPSAHSFSESNRWWNVRSVRKYCEAIESGRAPVDGTEGLTEEQLRFESIILGLRTILGFDLARIPQNHQSRGMLSRLKDTGFLRIKNGRIIPSIRGFLVADYLAYCLGG
jgi:oxygen-independent coproporphyrinogen-3 oxidase